MLCHGWSRVGLLACLWPSEVEASHKQDTEHAFGCVQALRWPHLSPSYISPGGGREQRATHSTPGEPSSLGLCSFKSFLSIPLPRPGSPCLPMGVFEISEPALAYVRAWRYATQALKTPILPSQDQTCLLVTHFFLEVINPKVILGLPIFCPVP